MRSPGREGPRSFIAKWPFYFIEVTGQFMTSAVHLLQAQPHRQAHSPQWLVQDKELFIVEISWVKHFSITLRQAIKTYWFHKVIWYIYDWKSKPQTWHFFLLLHSLVGETTSISVSTEQTLKVASNYGDDRDVSETKDLSEAVCTRVVSPLNRKRVAQQWYVLQSERPQLWHILCLWYVRRGGKKEIFAPLNI